MESGGGENTVSGRRLLGLKRRQYGLLAVLMAAVVALFLTSVISVAAHDDELHGLYSEEADGTAMTFVQRESFGLIIELDRWSRGDATARDVQIARALLGQRLQVRTASDVTTYELTDEPFRASLAAMDDLVRSLDDAAVEERVDQRRAADDVVDAFEVRTRELSTVFQEITRTRAAEAINRRAITEQTQALLAGVIILLGVGLAGWIATDLRSTYRDASERLRAETARLDQARRRLEFRQRLADHSGAWSQSVTAGVDAPTIVRTALADLEELMPGLIVRVVDNAHGPVRIERAHDELPSALAANAEDADVRVIDDDDVLAAIDRVNEILNLVHVRDHQEQALDRARRFDPLTQLPKREHLQPAVANATDRAHRSRSRRVVTLALVDINRFADFNLAYGAAEGDRLLVTVARTLVQHSRPGGDVLRLSADEFAVVGTHATSAAAEQAIAKLSAALSRTYEVAGEQVAVSATIGAVIDGATDQQPDALVQRAAAALAAAQATEPRPAVRYFIADRDAHLLDAMREESALRSALRSGEFVTHVQPIIDLESGAIAACEALVRWNRPGVGLVRPDEFLPAIARAGLTVELGWQIIDGTLTAWGTERAAAEGALDGLAVSINLDAAQLAVPTLSDYLVNAAERNGLPLTSLVVEVTEHALLVGEGALTQLEKLRARGVRVALDDFGTGYSSLAQANALPLDVLKLDRSFLPDPQLDAQQSAIIRDIVSIANTLGLAVTAEGIETEELAEQLRNLGVHYGQGWWAAKAMPIDELPTWAASRAAMLSGR